MWKKFGMFLNMLESRLSLWNLIYNGFFLFMSVGLPAWGVKSANVFVQYKPLSWILAGFGGLILWVFLRLIWVYCNRISVQAKYDAKILERGSPLNPLDLTFEGKRIYLDDLVLPSYPIIEGKTFINCDLIGPGCIYLQSGNQNNEIRGPVTDGVWLDPSKTFNTGFIFNNCTFRKCSFQRITIFASVEYYEMWKNINSINWISIPPSKEDVEKRLEALSSVTLG